MIEKILEYEDDHFQVKLVVSEATVFIGMKRALLRGLGNEFLTSLQASPAEKEEKEGPSKDRPSQTSTEKEEPFKNRPLTFIDLSALRITAGVFYPDLLAATVEWEGLDPEMTPGAFVQLPDPLTNAWSDLVYELNPHWLPTTADEEGADSKKEPSKPE